MQKKFFYRPTYPIFFRTITGNKQLLFLGLKVTINNILGATVNSRKSQTLFINYGFRWLMVAEIFAKQRSKLRHWPKFTEIID